MMDSIAINMGVLALIVGNVLAFMAGYWVIRKVIRIVNSTF